VSDSRRADAMPVIYIVGGIVALGLLVYLTIALLKPEIFS
jgi:K+-transporting ATPase KdpF subunit